MARERERSRDGGAGAEERLSQDDAPHHPPRAPDIERRFRVHAYQWIGLPLLVLIPVLAALGVFGPSRAVERTVIGGALIEIDYPTIAWYGRNDALHITVRAIEEAAVGTSFTIRITGGYLGAFHEVRFTPDPHELRNILVVPEPDRTNTLTIDGRPHRYGRTRGAIELRPEGGWPVLVQLSTLILP